MRLYIIIFIFIFNATISVAQDNTSIPLQWRNIQVEYSTFDDIKPFILNKSDTTVYFSGIYCFSNANVLRLNEITKEWEYTFRSEMMVSTLCDTTFQLCSDSTISVAVLHWGLIETSKDTQVVKLVNGQKRPINGTYRLVIEYSLEALRLFHRSKSILRSESPAFKIIAVSRKQI